MWSIAHRGGGELFPENTLTAFIQAAALGVDMVECDVHLSQDGQLMVIHDATLERTGGRSIRVDQLSAQELQKIDVGDGHGVPTLPELLEAIDIPVVVEIKIPTVVPTLIALLQKNPQLVERVVPISFFHGAIKTLRDQISGLEAGILLVGVPVDMKYMADSAHVRLLSLYHELVNKTLVDEMHRHNIVVAVWTPNSENEIQNALTAQVDGITSDRPDRVLHALGRS